MTLRKYNKTIFLLSSLANEFPVKSLNTLFWIWLPVTLLLLTKQSWYSSYLVVVAINWREMMMISEHFIFLERASSTWKYVLLMFTCKMQKYYQQSYWLWYERFYFMFSLLCFLDKRVYKRSKFNKTDLLPNWLHLFSIDQWNGLLCY